VILFFLNVHAPTDNKSDDTKDRFCEESELVFDHFPKYHMKILLGDFDAKVGREVFANYQSGIRIYVNVVMIMGLE
jgi:hypothetical protein